jgi:hypothetical protein
MDDIIVEVSKSFLHSERYTVIAHYKNDPFKQPTCGYGYAERGLLLRWFGIGDSLDVQLKKATCKAIEDLKIKHTARLGKREFMKFLNEKAQSHVKSCMEKEYERE